MIQMLAPHMLLHPVKQAGDQDYPEPDAGIKMKYTHNVPPGASIRSMVENIISYARMEEEKKLSSLVISSHGKPGEICIGEGITLQNIAKFEPLRGYVSMIWVLSCRVAQNETFCSEFAKACAAMVIAGTEDNTFHDKLILPYGYIDDYEGTVYMWSPLGNRIFRLQ